MHAIISEAATKGQAVRRYSADGRLHVKGMELKKSAGGSPGRRGEPERPASGLIERGMQRALLCALACQAFRRCRYCRR